MTTPSPHPRSRRLAPLLAIGVLTITAALVSCRSFAPSSSVESVEAEPEVRVRILARSAQVVVAGPAFIRVTDENDGTDILNAPLTLLPWPDKTRGLRVTDARGTTWSIPSGVHLAGVSSDGKPVPTPLELAGAKYLGSLFVRPSVGEPGGLDAINITPIEPYIAGVISKELYPRWPEETFCVQAVCARSYALHQSRRARASGRDYDLEATTADQVFPGLTDHVAANNAARRTRGIILTYRGAVLRTYYSSTCGGRSSSARDVWGLADGLAYNRLAPLQAHARDVACQPSPLYRWEVSRSVDDLSRRIAAWGKANSMSIRRLGRVRSIRVEKANDQGRPVRYAIVDDLGRSFLLAAEQLRVASNFAVPELPPIERATRVHSGDFTVRVEAESVTISGRGFGHGVGMCQFCAKGMSDEGVDWRTMLKAFYPGATFDRAF